MPIADCDWTNQYIKTEYDVWIDLNGNSNAFIIILLEELGNLEHLDRLTIMLRRPNQMKGAVSTSTSQKHKMRKREEDAGRLYDLYQLDYTR